MICFNILACSKSGSRFALAWVGTRFRRLGSLDRKSRSRVCRSSFFPDGSNMKENLTSQGFLLFCKNLINLSFLFFVVCNTWSFRHNLNQNKSINKFLRLHSLLFFTFYVFPFCLEINTHTDHILISWEAMNRDWLQQKPPARWTHSSLSEETWMSCVCIQFTTFCWADIFEVTWVGYESDLCHWSDTRQGCVCNIMSFVEIMSIQRKWGKSCLLFLDTFLLKWRFDVDAVSQAGAWTHANIERISNCV